MPAPGRSSGRRGRSASAIALLALLACGCGADPGAVAVSEPAAAASDIPAKEPVSVPIATQSEDTDHATQEATLTDEVVGDAPAASAPPAEDLADLPNLHGALLATLGQGSPSTALARFGPFDTDIPFPDDALVLAVGLEQADLRVLTGNADAHTPIEITVGTIAITRRKIEEIAPVFLDGLPALGYELSTSGFSSTTEGDGTEVRRGLFHLGDLDQPGRETIDLALIARPSSDWVEIDIDLTISRDPDEAQPDSPIWSWAAGFPVPEGFGLHRSTVRTSYIGRPSLTFSAQFTGPAGQVDPAMGHVRGGLPAGGFDVGERSEVRGQPDLRVLDLAFAGVGGGEVAISESSDRISISPDIRADFDVPEPLAGHLLG